MSFYDLFQKPQFKAVYDEVEQFTKRKLEKYNDYLEKVPLSKRPKEIFDAVWGNIGFSAEEIYILDSPLLQRLRNIKQLGLAYFVYCGSDYSRFYHTIGVVFLADRMATSLNRWMPGPEKDKAYFKEVVRLAAIFHDVGHMFLSHVSEHYFAKSPLYPRYEMISAMLEQFERSSGKSVALHELLSCMMVNTSEVKRLLTCVGKTMEETKPERPEDIDCLVEYISCLISGVPVDREILPYSSIINGPIDADKCDYLSRDSHVTRVPVAVDISRLTQKLNVVESEDIYKSELWHTEADTSKPYLELAMSDSAEKALFQLCIARTIMFDSVYYHQKVLTAETELRSLVNRLANLQEPLFVSFVEILEYVDNDFNHYFFDQLESGRNAEDIAEIRKVQREWEAVYARNMAKRIACILPEFLEGEQRAKERLFDEILTTLNSGEESTFLEDVLNEYRQICKIFCCDYDENNVFIIQSPTNVFGHSKIQVPIHLDNGQKREFRGYELVNSRETSSSASYVVTNAKNRIWMYLALEKAMFRKYRVFMKGECSACGKFEAEQERGCLKELLERGYYDDSPELIRDVFLYNYLSESQIRKIKEKFEKYAGPHGYTVGMNEIGHFFKQIICACDSKADVRSIVMGISRLLMEATVIDRKFVVDQISTVIKTEKLGMSELAIVPMGSLRDSGKHISYYFNDVRLEDGKITTFDKLQEVLEKDSYDTVVFFDDGSYSGNQAISMMQEYMGMTQGRATSETHVEELSEPLKERFKEMKIIFFFLLFHSEQRSEIQKKLCEIGLDKVDFICARDMNQKIFDKEELFENEEQMAAVRDFLFNVGTEVMASVKMTEGTYKEHWNEERVKKAALGYNDAQQMVILESSVPTYTITAFWQAGKFHKFDWVPLFRRTQKEDS